MHALSVKVFYTIIQSQIVIYDKFVDMGDFGMWLLISSLFVANHGNREIWEKVGRVEKEIRWEKLCVNNIVMGFYREALEGAKLTRVINNAWLASFVTKLGTNW